jgi:hypothetical protein
LEGLALEDVGIFYGHFVHFTVFCYISWTFGKVCGNLVYFSRFGFCTKKNLATLRLTGGKKQITQVSKKNFFIAIFSKQITQVLNYRTLFIHCPLRVKQCVADARRSRIAR